MSWCSINDRMILFAIFCQAENIAFVTRAPRTERKKGEDSFNGRYRVNQFYCNGIEKYREVSFCIRKRVASPKDKCFGSGYIQIPYISDNKLLQKLLSI